MSDNESKKILKYITDSMYELKGCQDRVKDSNLITHRYIGTIINNTLVFLCSVANSLDGRSRHIEFDQMRGWKSAMQAVHRSFVSTLHLAIETGLEDLCTRLNVTAESSERKRYLKIVNEINGNDNHKKTLTTYFEKRKPSFEDKVNAILKYRKIIEKEKKIGDNSSRH